MAGYLSKSFDPEAVALTSDVASSALYAISTQSAAWEAGGDHGGLSGLTDDDHTQYLLKTGLVFPFYVAAGTLDTIPLTADQKLPFFDSAAAAKNIALTT